MRDISAVILRRSEVKGQYNLGISSMVRPSETGETDIADMTRYSPDGGEVNTLMEQGGFFPSSESRVTFLPR